MGIVSLTGLPARLAHRARRFYWRLVRPTTLGSRCLVLGDDTVLLVRHTYEPWWYLPRGGVKRGESCAEAARREVWEETGLRLDGLTLFHLYHSRAEGKSDHIALFVTTAWTGSPHARQKEIAAAAFHPLQDLPAAVSPATRRRIAEYLGQTRTVNW